ncbi:MAG: PrsW family intramembrane metalloprotease [Eubacterium sp.]|nr:PrsW family intramembrane metalloprotease [Eubacterium sp.]
MIKLAVLPALILFFYVYKLDKIEKEDSKLLIKLFLLGAATIISAIVLELIGMALLSMFFEKGETAYIFIANFLVVAVAEEGGKYLVLKKNTWNHEEFNYSFDAVLYAITVSLGFATIENVMYVLDGGVGVAILRALTSVPGHAIFGLFMGNYYGLAKRCEQQGYEDGMRKNLRKALGVPVLLHGFYDFCLEMNSGWFLGTFLVFELGLTILSVKKVKKMSKQDVAL